MFKISFGSLEGESVIDAARAEAIQAFARGESAISSHAARTIAGYEYDWSRANANVFSLMYFGRPFDPAVAIKVTGDRIRLLNAPGVMSDVRLDDSKTRLIGLLMLISTITRMSVETAVAEAAGKTLAPDAIESNKS